MIDFVFGSLLAVAIVAWADLLFGFGLKFAVVVAVVAVVAAAVAVAAVAVVAAEKNML